MPLLPTRLNPEYLRLPHPSLARGGMDTGGLADADEGPDEETTVLSPAVAPQD